MREMLNEAATRLIVGLLATVGAALVGAALLVSVFVRLAVGGG